MKYSGVTKQDKVIRKVRGPHQLSPAEAIAKFFLNFRIVGEKVKTVLAKHKLCHCCVIKGSEHPLVLSFAFCLHKYRVL